ncbi:MAG: glycosyltransferase family 2 protein [Verrucomicrobiota bacterium]|nr:glycosyltransferase family 2 protein [Verrucomicrobiota bacterium]
MIRETPDLSVVIVSWNSRDFLGPCLRSVLATTQDLAVEIIVVDNGSTDGAVDHIRCEYPGVRLMAPARNIGFPAANNMGFGAAKGRYLLALNPDTVVHPGTIARALSFLEEHPDCGCVGVKTLKPNGKIQFSCARRVPTLRSALASILMIDKVFARAGWLQSFDMTEWDHEESRDVDAIAGSFMMFSRKLIGDIGGFDERLPMFLEDIEFCLRLRRRGLRIRYLGNVSILHHGGQSTNRASPRRIAELRYEAWRLLLQDLGGVNCGRQFARALLWVLPLKVLLLPALCLGVYIRNRERRLVRELIDAWVGIEWALSRLSSRAPIGERQG